MRNSTGGDHVLWGDKRSSPAITFRLLLVVNVFELRRRAEPAFDLVEVVG